jgi:hypothetical protein
MLDWSALLVGLGVGGVVGALASAVVAAGRVTASFAGFSSLLKAYLSQRSDPESQLVATAFGEVESSLSGLLGTLQQVKRALRWK